MICMALYRNIQNKSIKSVSRLQLCNYYNVLSFSLHFLASADLTSKKARIYSTHQLP